MKKYTYKTRRPKIEVQCEICGKEFLRLQSHIEQSKHTYCSWNCYKKREHKNNKVMVSCTWCNQPILLWPYRLNDGSKNHFCSRKCRGKWFSAHLIADKANNWKGGYYSTIANTLCNSRYRRIREIVLALDGHKCQLCGSNLRLEIHHIIEKGKNPTLIFDIFNMITLCKKCHCKIRNREELFIGYFSDIVAKRANSVDSRTDNTELNGEKSPKCVETIYSLRKE